MRDNILYVFILGSKYVLCVFGKVTTVRQSQFDLLLLLNIAICCSVHTEWFFFTDCKKEVVLNQMIIYSRCIAKDKIGYGVSLGNHKTLNIAKKMEPHSLTKPNEMSYFHCSWVQIYTTFSVEHYTSRHIIKTTQAKTQIANIMCKCMARLITVSAVCHKKYWLYYCTTDGSSHRLPSAASATGPRHVSLH